MGVSGVGDGDGEIHVRAVAISAWTMRFYWSGWYRQASRRLKTSSRTALEAFPTNVTLRLA